MVAPETYAGAALAANAIWTLLDQRRYEDILTYLTPDCAWERTEGWRHGHRDLRASFLTRPSDLLSRQPSDRCLGEAPGVDRQAIRSVAVARFGVDRMVDEYVAAYGKLLTREG